MKRNGEDSGVLIECPLDAVAMVGIDIDIHHSLALIQEMANDQHRIIDIAEPGGPVCQGMVQPAGHVEADSILLVRFEMPVRADKNGFQQGLLHGEEILTVSKSNRQGPLNLPLPLFSLRARGPMGRRPKRGNPSLC